MLCGTKIAQDMRLYKYYSFDSGILAIESQKLGFRNPSEFNDPFELSFFSNSKESGSKKDRLQDSINQIRDKVYILSLTRTPKNPLMWAHYGNDHKGFVIGYSTNDKFLSSNKYNIIPVEEGDVVYTNTKSRYIFSEKSMQKLHSAYLAISGDENSVLDDESKSISRKIFLTKHSSWVYEEEVRVVKVINSMFMESQIFQRDPLRSYTIPTEIKNGKMCQKCSGLVIFNHSAIIKSVYLGVRNPILERPDDYKNELSIIRNLVERNGIKVWRMIMSKTSWSLEVEEVDISEIPA
jgi:hypothetical protein